jgi:hypothetical protein
VLAHGERAAGERMPAAMTREEAILATPSRTATRIKSGPLRGRQGRVAPGRENPGAYQSACNARADELSWASMQGFFQDVFPG